MDSALGSFDPACELYLFICEQAGSNEDGVLAEYLPLEYDVSLNIDKLQVVVSMQITNISEAKASLSHLIKVVRETNTPVIIGKAGEPVAVLSAYKKETEPRKLGGSWEGKVTIRDDFDETDNELNDSFYNSTLFPNKL